MKKVMMSGERYSPEAIVRTLRDEMLKRELFYSITGAQIIIEAWRQHYNKVRVVDDLQA